MRGIIRSTETCSFEATAPSVEEARAVIEPQVPGGFQIISAVTSMTKTSQDVTVTVTAQGVASREVEGPTLAHLREATPEGWQLIAVHAV